MRPNPKSSRCLRPLGSSNDDDAENLLRGVIAKNPDRKIQALACKSLADGRDLIGDMVEQLNQNAALRRNFESVRGKDYVAKLLAGAAERKKEAVELERPCMRSTVMWSPTFRSATRPRKS